MQLQGEDFSDKIKDLDQLAQMLARLREQGKKIVHCHGVFDLMHLGHIRHFRSARKFGDILVVTLTPDQWVNKGPDRPVFTQNQRAEFAASLDVVDFVAINRWPIATETIKLLKPHFYVKGSDYADASKDVTGGIKLEADAVESVGGKVVFTNDVTFSSSALLNRHFSHQSAELTEFIQKFKTRHDASTVLSYLDAAANLKVLVIGETIIDEYHYCQTLGKSNKEPILAARFMSSEKFAGGNLAVANHTASFCDSVRLYTFLGDQDSHEDFIRQKLNPKIDPSFFVMKDSPTILKRRLVESYPFQKMFEEYFMKGDEISDADSEQLCHLLINTLPAFDLVIATDYGHGMLTPPVVDVLCKHARCLAINTQANAANHGFNTVSKYRRADYVCVSESEIRLESRQRSRDLKEIAKEVADQLGCTRAMITRGSAGMLCYSKSDGFVDVPALTGHFTDRVGAGDAVFAITSLCMTKNAPADIMGLIGNAVGALAVNIVGNRDSIDRGTLMKWISTLLK
jgi:rfaE bifunctional protein kinase chain/domain/rfaE bifunctional protein nucleotidyltransferase chain/domain